MLSSFAAIKAQKVFTVDYENQADVKVFVVNYENQADLKVFKVKYENQAGSNDGKWFFTQYSNQAKTSLTLDYNPKNSQKSSSPHYKRNQPIPLAMISQRIPIL
jgi:hypothetical protein